MIFLARFLHYITITQPNLTEYKEVTDI